MSEHNESSIERSTLFRFFSLDATHLNLSLVRIGFFSSVFGEILLLWFLRGVCFKEDASWVADVIVPLDLGLLFLVIIGYHSRIACIAHYICFSVINSYVLSHYHFDFVILALSFIFILSPKPQTLAVEARGKNGAAVPINRGFVFLIYMAIQLMYFDSLFFKYQDRVWLEGLVFWFSAVIPPFSTGMYPQWAENVFLMKASSYIVLAFETLFPIILIRKARLFFALIGITLHFGIMLLFPIPFFGMGLIALYLLFIDFDFLRKFNIPIPLRQRYKPQTRANTTCFALAILLAVMQMYIIFAFPHPAQLRNFMNRTGWGNIFAQLGIVRHPLYRDVHFKSQAPVLHFVTKINGERTVIPGFDEHGYPHYPEVTGRQWALFGFGIRQDPFKSPNAKRIEGYLLRWFRSQGIEPQPVDIFYKALNLKFEIDLQADNRIREAPLALAGRFTVDNKGKVKFIWEAPYLERTWSPSAKKS
jgi:hypothetical protein